MPPGGVLFIRSALFSQQRIGAMLLPIKQSAGTREASGTTSPVGGQIAEFGP
jgi:hypothetical protein